MGLLKDLLDKTIQSLANITDAAYKGDPNGTDANAAYFQGNVHNYKKEIGKAIQPSRVYHVSPRYTSMGDYYFDVVTNAHSQIVNDGSSSSNKALININPKGDSYTEALNLNHNGHITLAGASPFTTIISGDISISNGVYIFENLGLTGTITITGGSVELRNVINNSSLGTSGNNAISLIISHCRRFGYINIDGNNKTIIIKDVDHIKKDGSDKSIILTAGMTGGKYILNHLRLEGSLDEGTLADEVNNVTPNADPLPII